MYNSLGSLMSEAMTAWENCDPQLVLTHLEKGDYGDWILNLALTAQTQLYEYPTDAARANFWSELKYGSLFPDYTEDAPTWVQTRIRALIRQQGPKLKIIREALEKANLAYTYNPDEPKTFQEALDE